MHKITTVLHEIIRKTSRREVNASIKATRRLVSRQRHDLAELKRQMAAVLKILESSPLDQSRTTGDSSRKPEETRFRADGLKSHRAKLGLSAQNYGKLVGVSPMTIYSWEARRSRPRKSQLAKLAVLRKLTKSQTLEQLGAASSLPAKVPPTSPDDASSASPAVSQAVRSPVGGPAGQESQSSRIDRENITSALAARDS